MKRVFLVALLLMSLTVTACSPKAKTTDVNGETKQTDVSPSTQVKITKHPEPATFNRESVRTLPPPNPAYEGDKTLDLRSYDLSSLDLKDKAKDLEYAEFDSKTIWPKSLPDKFDPKKQMDIGKSPGLNVKKLHKKGITGKGVGLAIIDQPLLVDHIEYKDNLKMYEEIHSFGDQAQMHGPAVASIAVGKNVGVAPDADLYYIAETHGEYKNNDFEYDFTWVAKSIDRILEVNNTLPKDKKIRVISISVGWDKSQKGYEEVNAAVDRAKKAGVFVVSSSLINTDGYMFNGLGRNPLSDPEATSSYEPGLFWKDRYYEYGNEFYTMMGEKAGVKIDEVLLIPMDSRTTASPTDPKDYVFYREGGWSWSIPYVAGLYALACEVNPEVTPEIFWSTALKTGDTIKVQNNGKEYELKKVVNPVKLMEALK
ncbi:S8 family serine peptidase [Clostridium tunisiense]|uniref:S8 family serine peptidase n=1 Tax=Clostridium tunisiense TaxID=219748 RepID=UPI000309BFF5|nr:S8 family serine peptidase [Clostridium tunisiense]